MDREKLQKGHVIRYSYLWNREAKQGQEEGRKDRPCAVVLAHENGRIAVAPITHTPPTEHSAVELSQQSKARLGLDGDRSWIITNEVNHFQYPGHDLRNVPGTQSPIYGQLSRGEMAQLRQEINSHIQNKEISMVNRDDQKPTHPREKLTDQQQQEIEKIEAQERARQEAERDRRDR